ncbi:MAG: Holliday junction resolvase RuvX [Thermodesulfobacteriota bacterium]
MRYAGIDFGLKRIGLAITDPGGKLAFPCKTIQKDDRNSFFSELIAVLNREAVQAVVVGLPRDLRGQETLSTRQVQNFIQRLKRRTSLPVFTTDESLSSEEARQRLLEAGVAMDKIRAVLDQESAVIILERFLREQGKT